MPQGKVLEFLVAILAGLRYLQDISLSAHPLDKDSAVAQAWGQEGWADYSGVSRNLSGGVGRKPARLPEYWIRAARPTSTAR